MQFANEMQPPLFMDFNLSVAPESRCLLLGGNGSVGLDGLETWATHLMYVQDGELRESERLSEIEELKYSANLHSVVKSWLRSETKQSKRKLPDSTQKPLWRFSVLVLQTLGLLLIISALLM